MQDITRIYQCLLFEVLVKTMGLGDSKSTICLRAVPPQQIVLLESPLAHSFNPNLSRQCIYFVYYERILQNIVIFEEIKINTKSIPFEQNKVDYLQMKLDLYSV